jgi:hypothetical protein
MHLAAKSAKQVSETLGRAWLGENASGKVHSVTLTFVHNDERREIVRCNPAADGPNGHQIHSGPAANRKFIHNSTAFHALCKHNAHPIDTRSCSACRQKVNAMG